VPAHPRYSRVMATFPKSIVSEEQLADAVDRAVQRLSPDVIRIRYNFGTDTTGDEAIFFRIVLSAEAAERSRRLRNREVGSRVEEVLDEETRPRDNWGLFSYYSYRSESEPQSNDPGWE
jgi:hypothetical protein